MQSIGHDNQLAARSRWLGFVAMGLFGAMLFFVGRISAPRARVTEASASPTCSAPSDQARSNTARMVTGRLFQRIERIARMPGMENPESRANMVREYARGLADAVRMGRSDLYRALSQDFDDRLCKETMPDDKIILLAYFAMELPEVVDNRGLECFFSRAKGKENVALWYMMDAWRQSGRDKTAALAAIEATATDPRTVRRFMSPEQQEAAFNAAANGEATASFGAAITAIPQPAPFPVPRAQ
jgi:hypothetical protein